MGGTAQSQILLSVWQGSPAITDGRLLIILLMCYIITQMIQTTKNACVSEPGFKGMFLQNRQIKT